MPKPRNDIPIAFLRECFDLDPETPSGLRWRFRATMPPQWNSRQAGKPAGTAAGKGYWHIKLTFGGQERHLHAHRVVFALTHRHWPEHEIDHVHGVKAGNGIENLRPATSMQNAHNQKMRCTNTSGYPGVWRHRRSRKWQTRITAGGRRINLGGFNTREKAGAAYLAAKAILHPFATAPRNRMWAALTIIRIARNRWNMTLEAAAWEAFEPLLPPINHAYLRKPLNHPATELQTTK